MPSLNLFERVYKLSLTSQLIAIVWNKICPICLLVHMCSSDFPHGKESSPLLKSFTTDGEVLGGLEAPNQVMLSGSSHLDATEEWEQIQTMGDLGEGFVILDGPDPKGLAETCQAGRLVAPNGPEAEKGDLEAQLHVLE